MSWRVANSLNVLLDQINSLYPHRDKSSDGSIGDAAHASRSSDHNPWLIDHGVDIVTARDFTNDPVNGIASEELAKKLIASEDIRIKYVISNRKICSGSEGPSPWTWRSYSGSNPHNHHVHVSVKSNKAYYDNESPWMLGAVIGKSAPTAIAAKRATLRRGSQGSDVESLQRLLGLPVKSIDGDFGPQTEEALKAKQLALGLHPDGIAGPYTWDALKV